MLKCFEGCTKDGADFISIESTGGKEINDDALMNADIKKVIFSLGVLRCHDIKFLWKILVAITDKFRFYAGGDLWVW